MPGGNQRGGGWASPARGASSYAARVPIRRLLVANRGEVALRVMRTARDRGLEIVALTTADELDARHVGFADAYHVLPGTGPRAWLDPRAVVVAARDTGADAVHPGWGFLAESPALAEACASAGVVFVGPDAGVLGLLGDKVRARDLAVRCGIPVVEGVGGPVDAAAVRAFLAGVDGPVVVKAVGGGGGRGMRVITSPDEVDVAVAGAASEAEVAFGAADLYVERYLERTRHVEVQIAGDSAHVVAIGSRDCSLQRRHQKLVEVAPVDGWAQGVVDELHAAAERLGGEVAYRGVGTVEFLVWRDPDGHVRWAFCEVNPRLQVEHPVTEVVTGLDLVALQLDLAGGRTLGELGVAVTPPVRGHAVELRINAERMAGDGTAPVASAGRVTGVRWPAGPGVRVDTALGTGTRVDPRFDTLLAKLVVGADSRAGLWRRAARALAETVIAGVDTNLDLLAALVERPEVREGEWHTTLVDAIGTELVAEAAARPTPEPLPARSEVGSVRPGPPGDGVVVAAPMPATVVSVPVGPGTAVAAGQTVVVLESMKMEHLVVSPVSGFVGAVAVSPGDTVGAGEWLVAVNEADVDVDVAADDDEIDPDRIRPDLAEVLDRHDRLRDHRRPDAVAKRRARGQRTARENLADLIDPGSFTEYGALAVAAQHRRRSMDELIERTSTDGIVVGTARVNGDLFGPDASTCAVMIYDYTVLAGTQGHRGHLKMDRILGLAHRHRLPLVLYAEGGGGRPGDVDVPSVAGLDVPAFHLMARLSGHVPTVGVVSGYCFAGNAVLVGCCDTVVATENANLGAGGPAMIEGGGLGRFAPTEIGPIDDLWRAGSVDVRVDDEAAATRVVKRYLSYFQGPVTPGDCADQRRLRHLVPENRVRVYDVRAVVDTLADTGSVLELRRGFGPGMVTALARIEGRAVGILANDPTHLGGAIDVDGADKAARFLQLCDAFALPVVVLCDTPGIMVGPQAEREATVRHAARLFVVGSNLEVPMGTIVLRKGYGLGAQAMAAGGFKANDFTVSWPTGEFGGMNLEGAVRLGYRRELDAIDDPDERERRYAELVADAYARGRALNIATTFELDAVIDPAETRAWIRRLTDLAPGSWRDRPPRRPHVDTW